MQQNQKKKQLDLKKRDRDKKKQIIDMAIDYFSQNGIGDTTIDDIIRYLGIGKGTLYRYFENKKDLLLHCMERLTSIVVTQDVLDEIKNENNFRLRMNKRFISFLNEFHNFSGILALANQGLHSNEPDLAKQAKGTYQMFANPLIKDFLKDKKNKIMRDIDEEIAAYLIFGMGESMGRLLKINPAYTPEQLVEASLEMVIKGIYLPEKELSANENHLLCSHVSDLKGRTEVLYNLTIDDKQGFPGNEEAWHLLIPLLIIYDIHIHKSSAAEYYASVVLNSGQSRNLSIDGDSMLEGDAEFGRCRIRLKEINSIHFNHIINGNG